MKEFEGGADLDILADECGVVVENVLDKLQRAVDSTVPQWYSFNSKECKFLAELVKFHL